MGSSESLQKPSKRLLPKKWMWVEHQMHHPSLLFQEAARLFGTKIALIEGEQKLDYATYHKRVEQMAHSLKMMGLSPGDRLGILNKPGIDYVILLMACIHEGFVAVPISPRFPEKQIRSLLQKVGCSFLVSDRHEAIQGLQVIPFETLITLTGMSIPLGAKPGLFFPNPKQDATVIFTSGSTGEPKAVLHTYANHFFSALGSSLNIPFQTGHHWLLSLPLYHVGGMAILFRAILGGGTVVFQQKALPAEEQLVQDKITHISMVSTQLYRLLEQLEAHPERQKDFAHLKVLLLGGGPITSGLYQKATAAGFPVYATYGCTEMASQISTTPSEEVTTQQSQTTPANTDTLVNAGKRLPFRRMQLSSTGELKVKGETLFKGYLEQDGKLRTARDEDGWFTASDLGQWDDEGYLHIIGRRDNVFISGGENIQPEEIEEQLCQLPEILQAMVVAVQHPEFGKRPVAFLRTASNQLPSNQELQSLLEKRIPRFKIPDAFHPWPKLQQKGLKPSRADFEKLAKGMLSV